MFVFSSDPPFKDGNAYFTVVPLKALSDVSFLTVFFLLFSFSAKVPCVFLACEKC